jgi:hypothetical protein
VARLRLLSLQLANLLAARLDLVRATSWHASEITLVRLLDAGRADVVVK